MAAAEKEVLEKRGENHRLTAHDARVWPGALFAQRPMWFLGGAGFHAGSWLGEAGT
jgi:hypothetical protein